jgi:hypothetical protein
MFPPDSYSVVKRAANIKTHTFLAASGGHFVSQDQVLPYRTSGCDVTVGTGTVLLPATVGKFLFQPGAPLVVAAAAPVALLGDQLLCPLTDAEQCDTPTHQVEVRDNQQNGGNKVCVTKRVGVVLDKLMIARLLPSFFGPQMFSTVLTTACCCSRS